MVLFVFQHSAEFNFFFLILTLATFESEIDGYVPHLFSV